MRRFEPFFIILLFLVSCAPAQAMSSSTSIPSVVVPTTAPSVTSTVEPSLTPEITSTLEPTTTLTATPYPIPDGATKTDDGASVFVEDGRLYKVDASGFRTETEMSREVFIDVFEAGDLVKQLHPEYFDKDQSMLKDELMPKGEQVGTQYQIIVQNMHYYADMKKIADYRKYVGKVVDVTRIRSGSVTGVAICTAVYGSHQPIVQPVAFMNDGNSVNFLVEDVVINTRSQVGEKGSFGNNNLGFKSFSGANFEDLADYFEGKIVSSSYAMLVSEQYSTTSIFERVLSETERDLVVDSASNVGKIALDYYSRNKKPANVGVEVEEILNDLRKNENGDFFGLFPFEQKISVISD